MWSCDKLKTLYLHFHNTHDYQTQQGCDLLSGATTHEATRLYWSQGYMLAQGKLKTLNLQILFILYDYGQMLM